MKLTILGNSAAYPNRNGGCSAYLVEAGQTRVLLDCGPGIVSNLQHWCRFEDINAVWISHLHTDHFLDLFSLAFGLITRCYTLDQGRSLKRIPVYVPAGAKETLVSMSALMGHQHFVFPPVDNAAGIYDDFRRLLDQNEDFFTTLLPLQEYEPSGALDINELHIQWRPVAHNTAASAIRLEYEGRVLVYSGDTAYCDELVALAHRADVLLCDSSNVLPYDLFHPGSHLSPAGAAEIAHKAEVRRLLLTHIYEDINEKWVIEQASSPFSGPINIAHINEQYPI